MDKSGGCANGDDVFENGLRSEGNEDVIADVWTDYCG